MVNDDYKYLLISVITWLWVVSVDILRCVNLCKNAAECEYQAHARRKSRVASSKLAMYTAQNIRACLPRSTHTHTRARIFLTRPLRSVPRCREAQGARGTSQICQQIDAQPHTKSAPSSPARDPIQLAPCTDPTRCWRISYTVGSAPKPSSIAHPPGHGTISQQH